MKKHAHKWTIRSYSTKEVTFVCKCQETLTRAATKEEARKIKQGFAVEKSSDFSVTHLDASSASAASGAVVASGRKR
jgi:hypothetical protein